MPLDDPVQLTERQECVLSGVLAGALGVSEAFQFVRDDNRNGRTEESWNVTVAARGEHQLVRPGRVRSTVRKITCGYLGDRASVI